MSRAYIAVGSNVDAEANVVLAVSAFAETRELSATSTFYRTRPSHGEGPPFVNGVIAVTPRDHDPVTLLARTRALEHDLGRRRCPEKNAPRPIDLDVVAWPGQLHERLPHRDIERYDFVARPLAEIDGQLMTRSGRPVIDVVRAMPPNGMTALEGLTRELRRVLYLSRRGTRA